MKKVSVIIFLTISFSLFGQVKKAPPKPKLRTFSHFIDSNINKKGITKFFRKSDNYIFNGEYTIHETLLNTKTDIVNSYFNTGFRFFGFFNNGYKNGLWKTTYKNILVKTINYKNGLVIGRYRVYGIKENLLYKTTFGAQGNGKFKDYYYKTGIIKQEGNYENGKREGEWCDYDRKGKVVSRYYKDGRKVGNWRTDCVGKCNYTHKIIYYNKENYGMVLLFKNDKIWQKGERYVDGLRDGVWYVYDDDEKPLRKYIYEKGEYKKDYQMNEGKWELLNN